MRLGVLRATALCWFGNEYLLAADDAHLTELNLKSCFKGCERLEFVRPTAHRLAAPGASFVLGSKTWYRRLKSDGIESFRVHFPLSLLEPLPDSYGVVTDSPFGCDIWVPSEKSTARNVEYDAHRFAAWSLPRPAPSSEFRAEILEALTSLKSTLDSDETSIARRIKRLTNTFGEDNLAAEGFEDCIPPEFNAEWRAHCAQALRAVAVLGAEDLGLDAHPALQEPVDALWKLSLRLIEAIAYEVTADRIQAEAA